MFVKVYGSDNQTFIGYSIDFAIENAYAKGNLPFT
jgi:hypothetical protein